MKQFLLKIYYYIKYSLFVDRDKEFIKVHRKRQMSFFNRYMPLHSIKKLHIGSQFILHGWLNVDLHPKVEGIAYLDATKIFPLPDNSFDYVFSEHMIEHITFLEAEFMLSECFRILKPGGKIRIATPNLKFLVALYHEVKTNSQKQYIDFSVNRYMPGMPIMDTIVINNFFRDWGHQFIYDFKTLKYILERAGFCDVIECEVEESVDDNLKKIEQHGTQIGNDFNKLETIVVEASKL